MTVNNPTMQQLVSARERGVVGFQDSLRYQRVLHFPPHFANKLSVEHTYEGHNGCVNRLAWNADGSLLVSGSDDRRAIIWHYPDFDRPPLALTTEHRANIFGCQFLPCTGDRRIVTGAMDNSVQVHDLEASPGGPPGAAARAAAAAARQGSGGSGSRGAAGGFNPMMPRRATAPSHVQQVLPRTQVFLGHKDRVKDVEVEPMNPHNFWSAGEDGIVRQYDTRLPDQDKMDSPTVLVQVRDGRKSVQVKSIDINKAHPHLMAVVGSDPYIRLYDRRKLSAGVWKPRGATSSVLALAPPHLPIASHARHGRSHATYVSFSNRGDKVITTYHGDHAYSFDITASGDLAGVFPQPQPQPGSRSRTGGRAFVWGTPAYSATVEGHGGRAAAAAAAGRGAPVAGASGWEGSGRSSPPLPPRAEEAKTRGNAAIFERKWSAAVAAFSEALHFAPGAPVLYALRADALLKRGWVGDAAVALRDCDTAGALDGGCSRAFLSRIQALQALQQYRCALTAVDEYRQRFPGRAADDVASLTAQLRASLEERRRLYEARRQQQERRRAQRTEALARAPRRSALRPHSSLGPGDSSTGAAAGATAAAPEAPAAADFAAARSEAVASGSGSGPACGRPPSGGRHAGADAGSPSATAAAATATDPLGPIHGHEQGCQGPGQAAANGATARVGPEDGVMEEEVYGPPPPPPPEEEEVEEDGRTGPELQAAAAAPAGPSAAERGCSAAEDASRWEAVAGVTAAPDGVRAVTAAAADANGLADHDTAVVNGDGRMGPILSADGADAEATMETADADSGEEAEAEVATMDVAEEETTGDGEVAGAGAGRRRAHQMSDSGEEDDSDDADSLGGGLEDEEDPDLELFLQHYARSIEMLEAAAASSGPATANSGPDGPSTAGGGGASRGSTHRHVPGAWGVSSGGRRMLQRYVGQCNVQTDIKEVCYIGSDDRLVAAGSDCGRVFLYDADSGAALRALTADEDVANCVHCHPFLPVLATSGIENVVRLWSPRDSLPGANSLSELQEELAGVVERNQERMKEGPTVFRPSALQEALQDNPQLWHLLMNQLYGRGFMAQRGAGRPGGGAGPGGDGGAGGPGGGEEDEEEEDGQPEVSCRMA